MTPKSFEILYHREGINWDCEVHTCDKVVREGASDDVVKARFLEENPGVTVWSIDEVGAAQ